MGLFGRKKEVINELRAQAQNPNTSVEILASLTRDKDRRVREAVAGNMHTSNEDLEKLAIDSSVEVKHAVFNNKKANDMLKSIAQKCISCNGVGGTTNYYSDFSEPEHGIPKRLGSPKAHFEACGACGGSGRLSESHSW